MSSSLILNDTSGIGCDSPFCRSGQSIVEGLVMGKKMLELDINSKGLFGYVLLI